MNKNFFVFAVCGPAEHIDTLNFSLRYIRKFAQQDILVVTDQSRNEAEIQHDRIIDVKTPPSFNNKQAGIFLKTSLHRTLDPGPVYAYLDSDVLAVAPEINEIFTQRQGSITFAPDHCKLDQFSSNAVHCGLYEPLRRACENISRPGA